MSELNSRDYKCDHETSDRTALLRNRPTSYCTYTTTQNFTAFDNSGYSEESTATATTGETAKQASSNINMTEITDTTNSSNKEQRQKPGTEVKPKTTLLKLAASKSVDASEHDKTSMTKDDILRKGIDIARNFDTTVYQRSGKIITMVIEDDYSANSNIPEIHVVQSIRSTDDIIINMDDFPESRNSGHKIHRGNRHRQSTGSLAPLITDA